MHWNTRDDLGLDIVARLHDTLKVNEHWRIDFDRGFKWWPGPFSQTIWADQSNFSNSQSYFRIHCETPLLVGKGHAQDFEVGLANEMSHATLSSVVYDPEHDTYFLHTSAYFTHDNVDWLATVFIGGCAMQASEAYLMQQTLAKNLRAVPALSNHPTHGERTQLDPVLGAMQNWFRPGGVAPSRWIDLEPEWKRADWAMDRQANGFESDHKSHLKAMFSWFLDQNTSINLDVTTDYDHPWLGHGLRLVVRVPLTLPPDRAAHTAMELNKLERAEWLRCHMMGSWGYEDGHLEFEAFIPNTLYHEDVLESMTLSNAVRANWVNEQFGRWFNAN